MASGAVVRWLWLRSAGHGVPRSDRAVVCEIRTGPCVRFACIGQQAWIGNRADIAHLDCRGVFGYWQWPLFISVGFGVCCLIGTTLYWLLDSQGERHFNLGREGDNKKIVLRDILHFNRSFWLLAAICIAFYSCTFPFQTFGQKFLSTRVIRVRRLRRCSSVWNLCSLFFDADFWICRGQARKARLAHGGRINIASCPFFFMLAYTKIPPVILYGNNGTGVRTGALGALDVHCIRSRSNEARLRKRRCRRNSAAWFGGCKSS